MQNFTNPDSELIVGGYWRTSAYFEFLTVPKAGHFVPSNYFSPTYSFLSDYIASKKLVCKDASKCAVTAARCSAMKNCSGHGTCNQVTG